MLWNLWRENWFYFREFSRLFGHKITSALWFHGWEESLLKDFSSFQICVLRKCLPDVYQNKPAKRWRAVDSGCAPFL